MVERTAVPPIADREEQQDADPDGEPIVVAAPQKETRQPFQHSRVIEQPSEGNPWGTQSELWPEIKAAIYAPISNTQITNLATKLKTLVSSGVSLFCFDQYRTFPAETFIAVPPDAEIPPLWFVGDIHGDLLAFFVSQQFISHTNQNATPSTFFLGDLFDRGKFDKEVFYHFLTMIVDHPGQHAFVVGNHDAGLSGLTP